MSGHGPSHGSHEVKSHSSSTGSFNILKPLGVEEFTTGMFDGIIKDVAGLPLKVAGDIEKFTPGIDGGHGDQGGGGHH